jgi:hypothetical protein
MMTADNANPSATTHDVQTIAFAAGRIVRGAALSVQRLDRRATNSTDAVPGLINAPQRSFSLSLW